MLGLIGLRNSKFGSQEVPNEPQVTIGESLSKPEPSSVEAVAEEEDTTIESLKKRVGS